MEIGYDKSSTSPYLIQISSQEKNTPRTFGQENEDVRPYHQVVKKRDANNEKLSRLNSLSVSSRYISLGLIFEQKKEFLKESFDNGENSSRTKAKVGF